MLTDVAKLFLLVVVVSAVAIVGAIAPAFCAAESVFASESTKAPVSTALAATTGAPTPDERAKTFCLERLKAIPGPFDDAAVTSLCNDAKVLPDCHSEDGDPIIYFEKIGTDKKHGKRILSMSLIHGDERPAGAVNRAWLARLNLIDPRNTWRVLPIANPDGVKNNTRYNSHKVDLNRNFPSKDWDKSALSYWKKSTKSDARRYPGEHGGSESETQCLMKHIAAFKPDFIISIHTPLGVLDFDGPKIGNPGFRPLPWVGLGNYPGSLGRYMWEDRKVPVLTIELKGNEGIKRLEDFDHLQDIAGTVAIQASQVLQKSETAKTKAIK